MKRTDLIAIDPGLQAMGIALLDRPSRIRHAEVVTTAERLELAARIRKLRCRLDELLTLYRPRRMLIEATWPSRHPALAPVYRVAIMCERRAEKFRIPVEIVPSATVRRVLLGNGRAGKREMATFVAALFPELRLYLRQDERWKEKHFRNLFDAVALGLYGIRGQPTRRPSELPVTARR